MKRLCYNCYINVKEKLINISNINSMEGSVKIIFPRSEPDSL